MVRGVLAMIVAIAARQRGTRISYCAQQAWLMNATLKQNVVFVNTLSASPPPCRSARDGALHVPLRARVCVCAFR